MPSDQIDGAVVRPGESIRKALEVKVKDRKSSETLGSDGLHLSCAYILHNAQRKTSVKRGAVGAAGKGLGVQEVCVVCATKPPQLGS